MKYLHLIWSGAFRQPARATLMLLSITVAFVLYGPLETVRSTFANFGQSAAGHDRLLTMSKLQPGAGVLPVSLYNRIKEVPGVVALDHAYAFAGSYQDPKNAFPLETHTAAFFDLYPELELASAAQVAFERNRTAAIVGEGLAAKFNWKVGDKVSFQTAEQRKDGSTVWTFDVVGIYRFTDPGMKVWENTIYLNWQGFDETRLSGAGTVGWYVFRIADAGQLDNIAHEVDALSANSAHETRTQSENAFSAGWISEIGDFGLILTSIMSAVLFTLLLLTGHTIAQSMHERIPELAVLRTLGFSSGALLTLLLSESVLLLLMGCILGLTLATLSVGLVGALQSNLLAIQPQPVGGMVWLRGIAIAVLIGLIVGIFPAVRGLRLRIVDALAGR